jgi:OOP family OmpA-OmpF porin
MKNLFAIVFVAAVVSSPAFADDTGAYVGLNYGTATASGNLVSALNTSHSDTSYGLYGGYQFSKDFAAELLIVDMGTLAQGSEKNETNGVAFSAVGMLPISEKLSAFAKLGYARTYVKISKPFVSQVDGKNDFTYGLGAQYNFTEAVGARVSYDSYKVGKETPYGTNGTYTVVSAGVVYKF